MKIGAAVENIGSWKTAMDRLVPAAMEPLAGETPDLGFLFATNHFEDDMPALAAAARERTGTRTLLGCTAEGVIGPAREVERDPGIAIWMAHLPGGVVRAFHVTQNQIEQATEPETFRSLVPIEPGDHATLFVFADPFSFDVATFLPQAAEWLEAPAVLGGMASGVEGPGQTALILDDHLHREGAVCVAVGGALRIDSVVSQGCRPIGRPMVITAAQQNIIRQLGGKPALAMLQEVFAGASSEERKLMEQGLFVGQAISEYRESFERGDFLIRNMLGADQRSGALAIGDFARVGCTIQFHVRDARTADEDMRHLLSRHQDAASVGALLFSCNGRGRRMFPEPDHDVAAVQAALGPIPVAGFFAAGELGPVGGRNFIHGHTASLALFRPA